MELENVQREASKVSSPGLPQFLQRAVNQVIWHLSREWNGFLCHAWTEGHGPLETVWWRGAAAKGLNMKPPLPLEV